MASASRRPADSVLTTRELNRALLARQMLLERAKVTVPEALTRMAFLQAQYSPAIYIGLWSRVAGVERAAVTDLLERRAIIQGTLLRSTIHVVAAEDYWPAALAVRDERRTAQLRAVRGKPTADEFRAAADKLRAALASARCARRRSTPCSAPACAAAPASGSTSSACRRRARGTAAAPICTGSPRSGSARRRAPRSTASTCSSAGTSPVSARRRPRRSPTGRACRWPPSRPRWTGSTCAGSAPRPAPPWSTCPAHRSPTPERRAPVRFLSNWDAALLVHARRTGILPEEHRPKIFHTRAPQSFPTFLVDGAVAGTWKFVDGRVALEEFAPLPRAVRSGARRGGRAARGLPRLSRCP